MKYSTQGRAFILGLLLLPVSGLVRGEPRGVPEGSPAPSASGVVLDTIRYRTFLPESLLAKHPVKRVTIGTGWRARFTNATTEVVTDLTVRFADPVLLTRIAPFPDAMPVDEGRTWLVYGQSLAPGDGVTIEGTGPEDGTFVQEWHYGSAPANPGFLPQDQWLLFPMPNSANVRSEVFRLGGFAPGTSESDWLGGMVVGKSFLRYYNFHWRINNDSARVHGWVRLQRQGDLLRSLYSSHDGFMHTGIPRAFCAYDNGRPFVRQARYLSPLKQNNRLFADLAVLKINIAASQLGITTPGLGELVYQDHGHPLSDLMVREISHLGDSMLTYCGGWPRASYLMVDTVIRKINEAFSGPIDTVTTGDSLVLTGVRSLAEVPFLRTNPVVPPLRVPWAIVEEYADGDDGEEGGSDVVPEIIQVAQNFPNPFNPVTSIQFELQEFATVSIRVYDLLGREVRTLMDREELFDGTNEVMFDATGLSSGVYVYRIVAESSEESGRTSVFTGKMVLLR